MALTSEAEWLCRPSVGVGVASSGGALPFRKGVALRWGRSSSEPGDVIRSVLVLLSLSHRRGIFVPPSVLLELRSGNELRNY